MHFTLDHSLALCLVLTALLSSAYRAPMNEPMDVPPTMSIGIPASSMALITPTWEQPLHEGEAFFQTKFCCSSEYLDFHIWNPSLHHLYNNMKGRLGLMRHSMCVGCIANNIFQNIKLSLSLRVCQTGKSAHLAPPPPSTSAMLFPVRTRASREKSLCLSAVFSQTFSYTSLYRNIHNAHVNTVYRQ